MGETENTRVTLKEFLHDASCSHCGCREGPLYLHSKCHGEAPTWAVVFDGYLFIECSVCEKPFVRFKVEEMAVNSSDGGPDENCSDVNPEPAPTA